MLSFHSANTVSTYITNPKTSNKKCCAPNCWHRNRSLIVFNSSLSVLLFILLEHGKVKTLFFFFLLQHGVSLDELVDMDDSPNYPEGRQKK
jgi:hypothetical protein